MCGVGLHDDEEPGRGRIVEGDGHLAVLGLLVPHGVGARRVGDDESVVRCLEQCRLLAGEALGGVGASVSDTAEFLHNSGLPSADISDEDNIMRLRHEVETQKIEWNENYNICSNLIEVICRTEIES